MEQIKNDKLVLTVSEHGAELQSIKDENGKEYLWDGDEKYWNRHSPILFPLVCGLWKDTYRCEGHTYHLSRHGFARDTDFQLIAKGADRITFCPHGIGGDAEGLSLSLQSCGDIPSRRK